MGIHTPIDKRFRFGELYGIRKSYRNMNRSIGESNAENRLFDMMMARMVENGSLEKIDRFAKKNRRLCNFVVENSTEEAITAINEATSDWNIPKWIRKQAANRIKTIVSERANSIETYEYCLPVDDICNVKQNINESEDGTATSDSESEGIDKLINDIAIKKGILGGSEIVQSTTDNEFEKKLLDENKHNYSIQSVIIESIAGNERKKMLIPPTSIYDASNGEPREYLDSKMENVINGVNAICGMNFPNSDYTWMASGDPAPFLRAEMAVNSDMVRGNRLLNAYFGPAGEYKDYLYRADGTPRIELSKASSMSTIDKEVNAIMSYPIIRVYAIVISWDMVNGKTVPREIDADDFRGMNINIVT